MIRMVILSILAVLSTAATAVAGGGAIPFQPDAQVFRPTQRAVVAFNGEEQVLLLSTEMAASAPTRVLRVLPFPSQPTVEAADEEVFRRAVGLLQQNIPASVFQEHRLREIALPREEAEDPADGGEEVQRQQIGAHDIRIVQVTDGRHFITWAEDYLRREGVDEPELPVQLRLAANDYLKAGFRWFVFDMVELDTDPRWTEPIRYRFATKRAYYPLRITRAEQGNTLVRLVILSPRLLQIPDLGAAKVRLLHQPAQFSTSTLEYLDPNLLDLFDEDVPTLLRVWKIQGKLGSFRRDVYTTWH